MPMHSDLATVMINGKAHSQWESYDIESDLLVPADAFKVNVGLRGKELPDFVQPWSDVVVTLDGEKVLTGRVDEIEDEVTKRGHSLSLSGRDYAGILVDCAAPIFVTRLSTLAEIIAKVVRPLGITNIKIDADSTRTREKINVEPGDKAWDVLQNAAEANGLWPWFTPDGTLVIGGPNYDTPPVATLIMRRNGRGNNVESLNRRRNVINQFSEITVYGQCHGTSSEVGKNSLIATVKDDAATYYRPSIVVDHESDNTAVARDRARKLLADGQLSGFDLIAKVKGHRTDDGLLWAPGQRVQVESEAHNINGIFFLMSRRFVSNRSEGTYTELTLKQDGVWALDAHPHKRKHRRGKNDPGVIVDVTPGAA